MLRKKSSRKCANFHVPTHTHTRAHTQTVATTPSDIDNLLFICARPK